MLHTDGKSCIKLTEKEKQPDNGLVIKSVSGSECSEGKKKYEYTVGLLESNWKDSFPLIQQINNS